MKIWQSFGSGHSANLSVIGTFNSVGDAETTKKMLEDFFRAAGEEDGDPDVFFDIWKDRFPIVRYYGPSKEEFQLGVDRDCDIEIDGTTVSVTNIRSVQIGGFVKLMLLKEPHDVKVSGKVGP